MSDIRNIEKVINKSKFEATDIHGDGLESQKEDMEMTLESIEKIQALFEKNLASLGGVEGVNIVWKNFDENKKQEILTKIKDLSQSKFESIEIQKEGFMAISPLGKYDVVLKNPKLAEKIIGLPLATILYSMTALTIGPTSTIEGTLGRISNSIKIFFQKKKLMNPDKYGSMSK